MMRNNYEDGSLLPKLYDIFNGEVANITTYGAFIKIPGCRKQGLVHKSQMSSARIEDPNEMLAKGEKVFCKVISMEEDGEKISLSMKVVNQTTGQDLDKNNVQASQDEKKRRTWKFKGENKIELGAELNTTCRKCGGHGHFAIDCFVGKGNNQYDLIPDIETLTELPPLEEREKVATKSKKKKKEKKRKEKSRKKKRHRSTSTSCSGTQSDEENYLKMRKTSRQFSKYTSDIDSDRKPKKERRKKRDRSRSSSYFDSNNEKDTHSKSGKKQKQKYNHNDTSFNTDSDDPKRSKRSYNSKESSKKFLKGRESRSPVALKFKESRRDVHSDFERHCSSKRRESRSPEVSKSKDRFRKRHSSNSDSEPSTYDKKRKEKYVRKKSKSPKAFNSKNSYKKRHISSSDSEKDTYDKKSTKHYFRKDSRSP